MVPALIERVRREIALARVVGKFTVDRGVRTVRRRLEGSRSPTAADAAVERPPTVTDLAVVAAETTATATTAVRATDLVLPDYDHLPAAHVVAKLSSLTQAERDAVEEYETANRHRRTILGKLEQLRAAE